MCNAVEISRVRCAVIALKPQYKFCNRGKGWWWWKFQRQATAAYNTTAQNDDAALLLGPGGGGEREREGERRHCFRVAINYSTLLCTWLRATHCHAFVTLYVFDG